MLPDPASDEITASTRELSRADLWTSKQSTRGPMVQVDTGLDTGQQNRCDYIRLIDTEGSIASD